MRHNALLAWKMANVDLDKTNNYVCIWTDKHKRAKRGFRLAGRKIPGSTGANRGALARGCKHCSPDGPVPLALSCRSSRNIPILHIRHASLAIRDNR